MKLEPILNASKEAAEVLVAQNAILVHCAGFVQQVGDPKYKNDPLGRLKNAAQGRCNVSCSTITPGDRYMRNFTGPLGLILDPGFLANISSANFDDNGTVANGCLGRTLLDGSPPPTIPLEDAIRLRAPDRYNEICVHSYDVLGLLISQRPAKFGFYQTTVFDDNGEEEEVIVYPEYDIPYLRQIFPDLPFYLWDPIQGVIPIAPVGNSAEFSVMPPITIELLYGV